MVIDVNRVMQKSGDVLEMVRAVKEHGMVFVEEI